VYRSNQKVGRRSDESVLHEVSLNQGDKEPKERYNEERQTSNPGNMPSVWHQDVQNREELDREANLKNLLEGWVSHGKGGVETVNWVQVFCLENGKTVGTWWPGYVMGVEWWGG
jgi:hypothetical protein